MSGHAQNPTCAVQVTVSRAMESKCRHLHKAMGMGVQAARSLSGLSAPAASPAAGAAASARASSQVTGRTALCAGQRSKEILSLLGCLGQANILVQSLISWCVSILYDTYPRAGMPVKSYYLSMVAQQADWHLLVPCSPSDQASIREI